MPEAPLFRRRHGRPIPDRRRAPIGRPPAALWRHPQDEHPGPVRKGADRRPGNRSASSTTARSASAATTTLHGSAPASSWRKTSSPKICLDGRSVVRNPAKAISCCPAREEHPASSPSERAFSCARFAPRDSVHQRRPQTLSLRQDRQSRNIPRPAPGRGWRSPNECRAARRACGIWDRSVETSTADRGSHALRRAETPGR